MEPIRYHRQLSRSIYIGGIFTPRDFGLLIIALAVNMLTIGSNGMMAGLLLGYPAYLVAFRLGRPAGHDVHLFQYVRLPKYFRPGREERWGARAE
jgi:hypothetical protein